MPSNIETVRAFAAGQRDSWQQNAIHCTNRDVKQRSRARATTLGAVVKLIDSLPAEPAPVPDESRVLARLRDRITAARHCCDADVHRYPVGSEKRDQAYHDSHLLGAVLTWLTDYENRES